MYKKAILARLRPYIIVFSCGTPFILYSLYHIILYVIQGKFIFLIVRIHPISLILMAMIIYLIIHSIESIKKLSEKISILKEKLGVTMSEDIDGVLSVCDVQIGNKLYIDKERLINLYSFETYPITDIVDVSKEKRKHSNHRPQFYLNITTTTHKDEIWFGRIKDEWESAYTQIKALLYSEKLKNNMSTIRIVDVPEKMTEIDDSYAGMILDEEDIKNKEDRNDWLGSI